MALVRKVAFVSPHWTAYAHRLVRGALSYADTHGCAIVRDFRVPRDFHSSPLAGDPINQLRAWNPDGVLSLLENQELERLHQLLTRTCPVVSMCGIQLQPGVAVVAGSFPAQVKSAVQHLREQGLRSVAMLLLESEEQMEMMLSDIFIRVAHPPDASRSTFVEVVDPAILDDPDASIDPLPRRLAEWVRSLGKPCGVFCPQTGGGGYMMRLCHSLGLRVPQDVAVIGVDDADLSLASTPALTSIVPVGETIGAEAMRILDGMMRGEPAPKERVRVDAFDLHVRQSTGLLRGEVCDIAAAVDYINRHACGGISAAEVHRATQRVSSKTFHTHFKAATGETPGQSILKRQIEEARRLLTKTQLPITLVAEKSGFGSSSDFARRFRAIEKKSPSAIRKQARKK